MPFKLFGGDTIECRACHQLVSTDANECPNCGEPLSGFKLLGGDTIECRACHHLVSTDANECPNCGEPLSGFKLLGGDTIECRTCHKPVSTDANECPQCGEPLSGFKLFGGDTIECRACHKPVSTDANECPNCGEPLSGFKFFGSTVECRACHQSVSTDASECPHCGEQFKASSNNSRSVLKQYHSETRNENTDTEPNAWIIKLLFYGALIIAAIWLAFAIVLPLVIIDCALLSLIAGLIYNKNKTYWFILSVLGVVFIFIDYNKGWLTKTLVENATFLKDVIPILVYLNLVAGLVACYHLVINFVNENGIKDSGSREFTKKKIVIICGLLTIGILIFFLQRYSDSNKFLVSYSSNAYQINRTNSSSTENPNASATTALTGSATNAENANSNNISGVYPQASERLLTASDLTGLDKKSLKIMRNEIFARHGYIFKTKEMKSYFSNQSWYKPIYSDVMNLLTSIEKSNIELIKSYESN